jgi:hypothetical protein
MGKTLAKLASPFMDEEIFPASRQQLESVPADDEKVAALDGEDLEQRDGDQSESTSDAEDADGQGESTWTDRDTESTEWETALLEESELNEETDQPEGPEPLYEGEEPALDPADTIDEAAAQCVFSQTVRDRLEPMLDVSRARAASAWNGARHPATSGVSAATLLSRLERYVNRSTIEATMRNDTALKGLAGDAAAVLAVVAHQFQQKIYVSSAYHDGKVGQGTLDALGFVRHRDDALNAVDRRNMSFHVKGRSKAFKRLQELYRTDRAAFRHLGADVSPNTWYRLFVNAPFLGRPSFNGIHVELMRRLRQAEQWLLAQAPYRKMSPVEIGRAMNIDEDHHGGRMANNNSMHTLGLAVDIRYLKNPWVTGQHGNDGKPNTKRNRGFQEVSRNIAQLLHGTDEVWTPAWLHGLGSDPARTTESAYTEIEKRQRSLQTYLSMQNDAAAVKAAIERRREGPHPERVMKAGEPIDAAVQRWRRTIKEDRAKLQHAFGSKRSPAAGFMSLHRALVCALRDHGCLAWGAIDLGSKSNGDMMHFDCRAAGIGWKLSLPQQRTAGANHPCVKVQGTSEELETPASVAGKAAPITFLGGRLSKFTSSVLPMQIGVFCPKALGTPKSVDVLVYAHGHLDPCPPVPQTMPDDLITKRPFELGKLVDASNRAIVLVVPFLDWGHLTANNLNFEACFRKNMHALGTPAKLNGVVREVLGEVGRVCGIAPPMLQKLILAGHSRAYDFLDPLAMAHGDPEMSKGALAKVSEVWALDTSYTCPTDHWLCWLASKPNLTIRVFYRDNSGTAACGRRFAAVARKTGKRLQVMVVGEGHCAVPIKRLPKLLNPASVSPAPRTQREIEEERFDEAFAWDEHLGVNRQPEHGEADATDQEMEADEYEADEYKNPAQERGEAEGDDLAVDQAAEEQGNAASVGRDHEHEDDDRP